MIFATESERTEQQRRVHRVRAAGQCHYLPTRKVVRQLLVGYKFVSTRLLIMVWCVRTARNCLGNSEGCAGLDTLSPPAAQSARS